MLRLPLPIRVAAVTLGLASLAQAQWNPSAGQWGRVQPDDLRVMTWNVADGLCSSNTKVEGNNNWTGLATIVAAFQPDVLILQECGDNSGNGTGSGVDSTGTLGSVLDRFMNGGSDTWNGGSVTAYVSKYAPGYTLPHVFVSSNSDGFNRNVILSRYPFADLNGDGKSTLSDIPNVSSDAWAVGGDGGIRGFQFVEIDLPDAIYPGDVVVGGAHLKAGSGSSNHNQRVDAARNVGYFVHYGLNGAGTGSVDPNNKISDNPQMTSILGPDTPVILAGDWNEDEITNGQKGPADWLTQGAVSGGTDGTDRDGSDMTFDSAVNFFSGSDNTLGGSKLDYVAWQDSIATLRISTVFNTNSTPSGSLPPELANFPSPGSASSVASDHRPVIVDLELPVGCPAASTYCVAAPNSNSGSGARIYFTGSQSVSANSLVLGVQSAASNQFGIFYYGPTQIQQAFGDGFRCVSGGIFRFAPALQADFFGDATYAVDLTAPPASSGPGQISPGSTWNLQFWYRDPAAGGTGFNLSDALSLPFCP